MAEDHFQRFPHVDTYSVRQVDFNPATIDIMDKPVTDRMVVNMNDQIRTGSPAREGPDSAKTREEMFNECLQRLGDHIKTHIHGHISVDFPWWIGCGLGVGT